MVKAVDDDEGGLATAAKASYGVGRPTLTGCCQMSASTTDRQMVTDRLAGRNKGKGKGRHISSSRWLKGRLNARGKETGEAWLAGYAVSHLAGLIRLATAGHGMAK